MRRIWGVIFISLLVNLFATPVFAFTYTWTGVFGTDWSNGFNWNNDGGLARFATAPTSTDDVIIPRMVILPIFYPVVISGTYSCKSITFNAASGASLAVYGTLNVSGAILMEHNTGTGNIDVTLTGSGTLNAGSLTAGNTTVPTSTSVANTSTLKSNITTLNVSGLITVNSASAASKTNNAILNIVNDNTNCTVTAGGISITNTNPTSFVLSGNTVTSSATFNLLNSSSNSTTLKLTNAAPLSISSATYGGVDFYTGSGTGSSTVEYAGASAQTVYTNSTSGLNATPSVYQHLKFSAAGAKTANSGNLTISGDWTSAGGSINVTSPTVIFQGVTQSLIDNGSGSGGVIFKNVTFQGGGTKTISGTSTSAFSVSGTGLLTMAASSTLTVGTNGKLTLISDATGTATVAAIPSGCSITGNVSAQRYFKAGTILANTRNYRLLSSPVNVNTVINNGGATAYSSLSYLNSGSGVFIGGPGGTTNGFTVTNATPTIYVYKESLAASNTTFNSGNFKGLANISGSTLTVYNDAGTTANVTASLFAGNGYMLYYSGNNTANVTSTTALNKQFRFGGAYIDPDAATTTATGTLNQGNIPVKLWWNNSTTLSDAQTGFNLVGNPYASTIDWDTFSNSSPSAAIYGPNVGTTIYVFNYTNKNYGTYQANGTGINNASRYIASGQGFFVKATATTGAALTFTEAAKTTTQPSSLGTSFLLMGVSAQAARSPQVLHIKLTKDSINTDEAALVFEPDATDDLDADRDAIRLNGIANVTTLATYAKQGTQQLAINHLHSIDSTTRVKLYVNSTGAAAINTLTITGFENIDPRYDAFLIDNYKNDSLQISLYGKYDFNLSPDNAATYGANRFQLVFHKKGGLNYRLLSLKAQKLNSDIELKWQVEAEQNYTDFTVEKGDAAGNYNALYSFKSNSSSNYTWLDRSAITGPNSYRLKQIDAFNHTTYNYVSVDLTPQGIVEQPIMVYPNPAVGPQLNIKIAPAVAASQMRMRVIGLNGQTLISADCSGNNIQQSITGLLPGTYIVEVANSETKKVIGRVKISKP